MDNNHLSNYLGGGFWQISERTVKVFGIEMALYITNLFDWRMKLRRDNGLEEDGFFYLRQDDIQKRTGLTPDKQRKFISILITPDEKYPKTKDGLGIIEVSRRKTPAQNFYKINSSRLIEYIEEKIQEMSTTTEQIWQNTISGYCETQYVDTMKHNHINNNNSKNNKDKNNDSSKEESSEAAPQVTLINSPSLDKISEEPILKLHRRTKLTLSPTATLDLAAARRKKMKEDLKKTNNLLIEKEKQKKREATEKKLQLLISKYKEPTPEMEYILNYWKEKGFNVTTEGTIGHYESMQKLQDLVTGKLFRKKYTMDDIQSSIYQFSLVSRNESYEPKDKGDLPDMSLGNFIFNKYTKIQSRLQFYMEEKNYPKLINPLLENKYPSFVTRLKKRYVNEVLGGVQVNFSVDEENSFTRASIDFASFWTKNCKRIRGTFSEPEKADLLFDAALSATELTKLTLGWICGPKQFTDRLPKHLVSKGIIDDNTSNSSSFNIYGTQKKYYNENNSSRADWTL